jgi:hypothetical protein
MRVDVCIPYWGTEPHRQRNFGYVHDWWVALGYTVHIADSPGETMNRAAARNHAATLGDAEVLVFADADTLGDPELIGAACRHAYDTGELSYPFNRFVGLSAAGTTQYLKTGKVGGVIKRVGPSKASPGGILAVHRDLFEWAGRYDEGFTDGWGYEDVAFARAARTLGGVHRYPGAIIHLWHPPAPEKRDAIRFKTGNRKRAELYEQADGDLEAMFHLLANR